MQGRSMPENSETFYNPILDWLRENLHSKSIKANFDVKLDYYNTGSFIRLMELFNLLQKLNENGSEFTIRWICDDGDEDNVADGEAFRDVINIPFEILQV